MEYLLDAMHGYLERTGMPHTRLGLEALGEETFFRRVAEGRVPKLGTADRVLAFMGHSPLGPGFRREVEAFLTVTRTKPYVLGLEAAKDPGFVLKLRRGKDFRLDTVGRVRAWMDANSTGEERKRIRALAGHGEGGLGDAAGIPEGAWGPAYLSTWEAAEYLGLSVRTLDRYRKEGGGPAYHRFRRRIRYHRADVEAWAGTRRVETGPKRNPDTEPEPVSKKPGGGGKPRGPADTADETRNDDA